MSENVGSLKPGDASCPAETSLMLWPPTLVRQI
jgi:hypothetical protein